MTTLKPMPQSFYESIASYAGVFNEWTESLINPRYIREIDAAIEQSGVAGVSIGE